MDILGGGVAESKEGDWSQSFFFFLHRGMYLGGKSGASQGVWSAAEMDHAILLVRCDAHEPWGVNEKRRQPAI